ncbi:MAG: response regulator transcription factor [Microbacteriaceae bacterium]|nr:response regulator transcription factor [Microbacteriaceae bacterium]
MRVIVADDSMLTREGIVRMLREVGVDVVAQACDADSLAALVDEHRPDVVVVDIKMPPTFSDEGLVAAAAIRARHPDIGVLVLSQYLETAYAMRLIEEVPERTGYLLKDRLADIVILVDALRRIRDGETVIDPTIVSRLLGRRRRRDPLEALSARERGVLALVAEGLSNRAIAARLSIAERTLETHVSNIFTKFGLSEDASSHRRVLAVLRFLRADGE